MFFFFNDTATTEIYTLSLHDALPISPRTVRRVHVVHPATGAPVDDALAACFRGPRSYTGEDLVELSTHGGMLVPAAAVAALVAAGARPARPGEFTRDRKSTRLNSSHGYLSYAVFCLKKKIAD